MKEGGQWEEGRLKAWEEGRQTDEKEEREWEVQDGEEAKIREWPGKIRVRARNDQSMGRRE